MINHHKIDIKASSPRIFEELVKWGESSWWPADSPMRYTRLSDGEVGVGTRFHQKVNIPFGPEWDVEVTSITPEREVTKRFLNGMFRGVERRYLVPGETASEVHYMMDFEVVGSVNKVLWRSVFIRKHDAQIVKILAALKRYLEAVFPG